MKALKQRFHKQIVRKHKENYFATVRMDLLQHHEFQLFYQALLDSGESLISLVDKWGYVVFFKHIADVLDDRLYQKLYQHNPKYFLMNLNFVHYLIQYEALPVQHIDILIQALASVITDPQIISAQNTSEIFFIIQSILNSKKYLPHSLSPISTFTLIPKLYETVIQKQANQHFFSLIKFCKLINNDNVSQIPDSCKIHCLQIHILTSSAVEQLYVSYSVLGDIFHKHHTQDQELYEYGSILDKTMKDIFVDKLIDPISYFLVKAFSNHSIKKLAIQLGYVQVIFDILLNRLMAKNNVSIFGHQSVWFMFRTLITALKHNKNTKYLRNLEWKTFKAKLQTYNGIKYPYLKIQVDQTLEELSKTNEQNIILNLVPPSEENIAQKLQQVQI